MKIYLNSRFAAVLLVSLVPAMGGRSLRSLCCEFLPAVTVNSAMIQK
ncbi:hypothetical protein [Rufibacter latericius]|nr:hypothetical protein [Rufibacter latericius]